VQLTELRAALDEACGRLMLAALLYTRTSIIAGSSTIAGSGILDLRGGAQ
jgi:hypothetical protein